MNENEHELRSLVREAIERHLGRPEKGGPATFSPALSEQRARPLLPHASHIILAVAAGSEADDGMCVIEPAVRCNHCGFCQSLGH